jgi:DNA-directed RNA polymerase
MTERDTIRNSIAEITRTPNWDGEKRYPDIEEVKLYQTKQKEISKDLLQDNLDTLYKTNNGASTRTGIQLIKEEVWELSNKFQNYLNTTKTKSKYLSRFCNTYPNHKDNHLSRCRELVLISLTHFMNSCLSQEDTTKVMRRTIISNIGSVLGPKLLADKEQEQYINKDKKGFKLLSRSELLFFAYGVRDQDKVYKARNKTGMEVGAQLVMFILDNSNMFEVIELTKKRSRKNGDLIVTIPYIQMTPEYYDKAQEMMSTNLLYTKGCQIPSIRRPVQYTSPSRYGHPLVRNLKYQYKDEENPSKFKYFKEDHSVDEMPKVYEAIDHIESSRYTVDTEMLVSILECIEKGVEIPGISTTVDLPPKPPLRKLFDTEREFVDVCNKYKEERQQEGDNSWDELVHNRYISHWFKILKKKKGNVSKCSASMRSLETASNLQEYAELFFPHNCDKRGRSYPLSTTLHPQINDLSKGILKSSIGCKVSERGAYWLRVNIATLWGQTETHDGVTKSTDKMTLDQRAEFVRQNWGTFQSMAMNPAKYNEWTKAEEPVQFLKAIKDYTAYNRNKETHRSHVSVDLDATCSGIQIYAMLYLDSQVAHSVNVSPTECPQDIYKDTADEMMRIVLEGECTDELSDELASNLNNMLGDFSNPAVEMLLDKKDKEGNDFRQEKIEILKQFREHGINRSHTKRPVMCLTYGLTHEGIRKYSKEAITDMQVNFSCDKLATQCFAHIITYALKKAAKCATTGMNLIQKVARFLARKNKPIKWTTPVGFKAFRATERMERDEIFVNFPKRKIHKNSQGESEVVYEKGRLKSTYLEPTGKMHGVKMANAMAPDFIHSLDASLLMMTVLKCKEKGVNFLKLVHDSYGTLCEWVDDLNLSVREAAYEIFNGKNLIRDWCLEVTETNTWEECKELINTEVLDTYSHMSEEEAIEANGVSDWEIEQGDLDMSCIFDSQYFVS